MSTSAHDHKLKSMALAGRSQLEGKESEFTNQISVDVVYLTEVIIRVKAISYTFTAKELKL